MFYDVIKTFPRCYKSNFKYILHCIFIIETCNSFIVRGSSLIVVLQCDMSSKLVISQSASQRRFRALWGGGVETKSIVMAQLRTKTRHSSWLWIVAAMSNKDRRRVSANMLAVAAP